MVGDTFVSTLYFSYLNIRSLARPYRGLIASFVLTSFSMAYGVDNAAVICCFMTSDYSVSYFQFVCCCCCCLCFVCLLGFFVAFTRPPLSREATHFGHQFGPALENNRQCQCHCNPSSLRRRGSVIKRKSINNINILRGTTIVLRNISSIYKFNHYSDTSTTQPLVQPSKQN